MKKLIAYGIRSRFLSAGSGKVPFPKNRFFTGNFFLPSQFHAKPTSFHARCDALGHLHRTFTTRETQYDEIEFEPIDSWEEEEYTEPQLGDGGDGGGIVLNNCPWGERALSVVTELLLRIDGELRLYGFRASPRGYIYVRLDKLTHQYGCPSIEEIESFCRIYKEKVDEMSSQGLLPDDLALEVSSPGADRLLRVPDDLLRFRAMPMTVKYFDTSHDSSSSSSSSSHKEGVYFLDSIDAESRRCVWKLADVRENRDPSARGRPLSRKQREIELPIPYHMIKQVTLYITSK